MKLEMKPKKILLALLGDIILGFGVGILGQANLGADPCTSFSYAASVKLGITFGQMVTITNITLLAITFFIYRKNIGIGTLMVVFLNQYPIDFITRIYPTSNIFIINVLSVILGVVLIAIGCTTIMETDLGMGIYDAFVFSFVYRYNFKFLIVRYVIDGIFFILTFVLNGPIGAGTILSYILLGPCIKACKSIADKIKNKV